MTIPASHPSATSLNWRAYWELCKPRVLREIVFATVVGIFLAVPGLPPLALAFWAMLGIALAAASAAAVNQIIEYKIDAEMGRTSGRPLPSGLITPRQAIVFAVLVGISSMAVLLKFTNGLTALLTFFTLIGYAIVYTVYLKPATPQNIVIGGVTGAVPPVLGWCAITGDVDPHALLLALIIFVWTPPHFWALAIARLEDYRIVAKKIPVLPVTDGIPITQLHIFLYTLLLFIVGLFPYLTHMSGLIYLAGAVGFGGAFIYHAWRLKQDASPTVAWKTFRNSLVYLVGIFTVLLVDHYVKI
ncbi:MAG: heme o synthase [Methylococcaceae bacterium]|nr:heme o synthase [Methylococcaceae bacterium]